MKVTTSSGFECEVKESAFDDWRVVELIAKIGDPSEDTQIISTVHLITRLLGEEQKEALLEHLEARSDDGIATVSAFRDELSEIMSTVAESKKNSSPSHK